MSSTPGVVPPEMDDGLMIPGKSSDVRGRKVGTSSAPVIGPARNELAGTGSSSFLIPPSAAAHCVPSQTFKTPRGFEAPSVVSYQSSPTVFPAYPVGAELGALVPTCAGPSFMSELSLKRMNNPGSAELKFTIGIPSDSDNGLGLSCSIEDRRN